MNCEITKLNGAEIRSCHEEAGATEGFTSPGNIDGTKHLFAPPKSTKPKIRNKDSADDVVTLENGMRVVYLCNRHSSIYV